MSGVTIHSVMCLSTASAKREKKKIEKGKKFKLQLYARKESVPFITWAARFLVSVP